MAHTEETGSEKCQIISSYLFVRVKRSVALFNLKLN